MPILTAAADTLAVPLTVAAADTVAVVPVTVAADVISAAIVEAVAGVVVTIGLRRWCMARRTTTIALGPTRMRARRRWFTDPASASDCLVCPSVFIEIRKVMCDRSIYLFRAAPSLPDWTGDSEQQIKVFCFFFSKKKCFFSTKALFVPKEN
jgi:hypothetical protein